MKKTLLLAAGLVIMMGACVNTAENGAPTNRLVDTTSVRYLPKVDVAADTTDSVPQVQPSAPSTPADTASGTGAADHSHEGH